PPALISAVGSSGSSRSSAAYAASAASSRPACCRRMASASLRSAAPLAPVADIAPWSARPRSAAPAAVGRDAHAQRVELDEARGVLLVVRAGVVLERRDPGVEQRIGRGAAHAHDRALVELEPHRAVHVLLRRIDQAL